MVDDDKLQEAFDEAPDYKSVLTLQNSIRTVLNMLPGPMLKVAQTRDNKALSVDDVKICIKEFQATLESAHRELSVGKNRVYTHLLKDQADPENQVAEETSIEPVLKFAAQEGKYMGGVLADFLPALKVIALHGSLNNKPFGKYERSSWLNVPNASVEYYDAWWRHVLEGPFSADPDTVPNGIHLIAIAWNALALLTFWLKDHPEVTSIQSLPRK